MGKWLNQLRENTKKLGDTTDKTDKTASETVLSVLSVRGGVFITLTPGSTGSVSFVSSQYGPCRDFRVFNEWHGWDEEGCQFAFDERAAILDLDRGISREEADLSAGRRLEAGRKRWLQ
ncbi:hypothetical protein [Bradyrhizobium liaoningense]|uniref:hypothetical protein n=1 Tax=Bradyrhizobium liaoningense TaxID=43992 RepID=UPI001BA68B90|nr:hypothetical protein [Bradyrhizobium liaoningense]MBR1069147.1 hypothetical protein [Bradyrhizobium liaoningense]